MTWRLAQGEGRLQRNFQGYSLRIAEDLLGLGVSSISQIGDFYLQNARDGGRVLRAPRRGRLPMTRGYMINSEDRLRRHVIMALICDLSLDMKECEREFGIDFFSAFRRRDGQLRRAEATTA
jgi:oxygen-independent coproporphyrinogen-3 oxidase